MARVRLQSGESIGATSGGQCPSPTPAAQQQGPSSPLTFPRECLPRLGNRPSAVDSATARRIRKPRRCSNSRIPDTRSGGSPKSWSYQRPRSTRSSNGVRSRPGPPSARFSPSLRLQEPRRAARVFRLARWLSAERQGRPLRPGDRSLLEKSVEKASGDASEHTRCHY